jgi:predicted RNase H-like nuclease (RuvC/YqgF family)
MTEEKINIVDLTRVTAKNMYEMLMELSAHIEKLQAENHDLKRKLEAQSNDTK